MTVKEETDYFFGRGATTLNNTQQSKINDSSEWKEKNDIATGRRQQQSHNKKQKKQTEEEQPHWNGGIEQRIANAK